MTVKTNAGSPGVWKGIDKYTQLKFFAGETAPAIYVIADSGRSKSDMAMRTGPSKETDIYTINAQFYLNKEDSLKKSFIFELDNFSKQIKIDLIPVDTQTGSEIGKDMISTGDIMIFSHVSREGDTLKVLLSSVEPKEYNGSVRFSLFEGEKEEYAEGVHLTDTEGKIYEPDEAMRKANGDDLDTFYFNIPEGKTGLKLVIPQIFCGKNYIGNDIITTMPKAGRDVYLHRELKVGETKITIENISLVPVNDPILPDDFKEFGSLKIDAFAGSVGNTGEIIRYIIPGIKVPDKDTSYIMVSAGSYCEPWTKDKLNGYILYVFDDMDTAKKIAIGFRFDFVKIGPWIMEIE